MITIKGLSVTEEQFRMIIEALDHHAEVMETLDDENATWNAQALANAFRMIGQTNGLDF